MRGEALINFLAGCFLTGRSPRARGSQKAVAGFAKLLGSIPACAGKPQFESRHAPGCRVDPRVRGEATIAAAASATVEGRSPRARGSLYHRSLGFSRFRSIPACAGKPCCWIFCGMRNKVDPRVRGEARRGHLSRYFEKGRSPRARGSHIVSKSQWGFQRSIPACAGKPRFVGIAQSPGRVDPRVRGEATRENAGACYAQGRSPRARGSPQSRPLPLPQLRSIPACAGKPS